MREPTWLSESFLLAVQEQLIIDFGGGGGLRDYARLEAALARPRQAFAYGVSDLPTLAAQYAGAIIMGHPFVDGNKRVGLLAAFTFLEVNGLTVAADEITTALNTLALAAGDMTEAAYADWLRNSCVS